nr:hypothetical protein CFP56_05696 [Quercus suber]
MVGNGHVMMACLESGGPCDSWWSVVGGTNGWQLAANGRLITSIIDGLKRLYIEKPNPLEVAYLLLAKWRYSDLSR